MITCTAVLLMLLIFRKLESQLYTITLQSGGECDLKELGSCKALPELGCICALSISTSCKTIGKYLTKNFLTQVLVSLKALETCCFNLSPAAIRLCVYGLTSFWTCYSFTFVSSISLFKPELSKTALNLAALCSNSAKTEGARITSGLIPIRKS